METDIDEQNVRNLSVAGSEEVEDLADTRPIISQPRPMLASHGQQARIDPQVLGREEPNDTQLTTTVDNQDQEETKSAGSTQLIPSRPNSPGALNRVARAFGTWAFDVEQQEAPSFNIPSPDGNEGLASTFVIPSPTVARNPAAARNRGELLLGRGHLMPKSRTLLPLDGPASAMRQASPVPGSLTINIIGHERVSGS